MNIGKADYVRPLLSLTLSIFLQKARQKDCSDFNACLHKIAETVRQMKDFVKQVDIQHVDSVKVGLIFFRSSIFGIECGFCSY